MIVENKKVIYLNEQDIKNIISEHLKTDIENIKLLASEDKYYGYSVHAVITEDLDKNIQRKTRRSFYDNLQW